jgi:phosphoribosylglycinamide formyltransferase-1
VVLAGFMRVLTDAFVSRYAGRLLNIHPSLLPSFPGLHTHRRALEAGVRVHGTTVHFVTPTLDCGPVVIQAAVPVLEGDDEDSWPPVCWCRSTASTRRPCAGSWKAACSLTEAGGVQGEAMSPPAPDGWTVPPVEA